MDIRIYMGITQICYIVVDTDVVMLLPAAAAAAAAACCLLLRGVVLCVCVCRITIMTTPVVV